MDKDRLDEKARQAFGLAGPSVDPDSFCQTTLAQEAVNAGKSGNRLRARSRRRKVAWRIAFAAAALTVAAVIVVAVGPVSRAASSLYPVSVNGKVGYINKAGSVVIKPQFDSANQFSEGLAVVWDKTSNKDGYIDTSGAMVIQPRFGIGQEFSEGLAPVDMGDGKTPLYGFIDKTGRVVIPAKFTWVSKFSEGLCWVLIQKDGQEDKTGFIDKKGNWVIGPGEISRADFSEGVALTLFGNYCSIIDQKGKVIAQLPGGMNSVADGGFSEGLAAVEEPDPAHSSGMSAGFIDKTGKVVIKPQFDSVVGFTEGLAVAGIETNGVMKYGYIDKTGAWVIKPQFSTAYPFKEGLAAVGTLIPGRSGDSPDNTLYRFIDKTGKVMIKLEQGQVPSGPGFSDGVARFDTYTHAGDLLPGSTTYIDNTGKVIWRGNFLGK